MSKITREELEKQLLKYKIDSIFDEYLFGYQLSKWIGFNPLEALNTKMFIFGISKDKIVLFPVTAAGSMENISPVVLEFHKDIFNVEYKRGFLSHILILNTNENKKIRYKISRYIIPYPWHNESVKKIFSK